MIVSCRVSLKRRHGWRPEGKSLLRLCDGDTVRLCCSANTEVAEVKSCCCLFILYSLLLEYDRT